MGMISKAKFIFLPLRGVAPPAPPGSGGRSHGTSARFCIGLLKVVSGDTLTSS